MKKTNILKIAFTLVMAFAITGVFAQANADYESNVSTDYVTINKSMPYFAEPDALFSPSFDATVSLTANVNTTFAWTYTAPGVGVAVEDVNTNNYVEVTFNELGTWTVDAEETYASCTGAAVSQAVEVVAAPDIHDFDFFENTLGITSGGAAYEYCGNQAAPVNVTVAFNGFPNFQLDWILAVEEIDGVGATVANPNNNAALVDYTGTPQVLGGGNTLVRVVPSADLVMEARTFTMIQNVVPADVRTKYTYTINGTTDNISRKSDYLGAATWYDNGGYTFEIIVNPAPVTGPIYHILNTQGNL